ncbi:MAG: DUF1853 family protein, partial [Planctomycetota bacterium]
ARGWWCHARARATIPARSRASRWVDLSKHEWLAPAVRPVGANDLLPQGEMQEHLRRHFRRHLHAVHLAELHPGLDGRWHEHARGFIVHDAWPERVVPASDSH